MPKTLQQQQLRVSWVASSWLEEPFAHHGALAVSACPGTKKRNTEEDLRLLRGTHGISHIVCLLNEAELRTLGIRDYKAKVSEHGLRYSVMPIVDMAIPENVHDTCALIASISSDMATGTCAIQRLREKRHKLAVQTSRQEQFVHWYAANMHVSPSSSLPQWPPFASCTRTVSKLVSTKHVQQKSHDIQPM